MWVARAGRVVPLIIVVVALSDSVKSGSRHASAATVKARRTEAFWNGRGASARC